MWAKFPGIVLGTASILLSCSVCDDDAGCPPGVTIRLIEPLSEPGNYEIKLSYDGEEHACVVPVPEGTANCSHPLAGIRNAGALAEVLLSAEPEELAITITRGEVSLLYEVLKPEYETSEKGSCGGTCEHAELSVDTP